MILRIKVKPSAKSNTITKEADGTISVRIAAPPVDGKANEELIRFLSEFFDISKSQVLLIKGSESRYKAIALPDSNEILQKLKSL